MKGKEFNQDFLSELSVRAQNVCLNNDVYDRSALIDYVRAGFDLRSLRNCGVGTAEELQRFIPETSIEYFLSSLSPRAKKVCRANTIS